MDHSLTAYEQLIKQMQFDMANQFRRNAYLESCGKLSTPGQGGSIPAEWQRAIEATKKKLGH